MTPGASTNVVTHGQVPDPKDGSIGPDLEVRIARELRSLLSTELPNPHDNAVALGARSLSDIFSQRITTPSMSLDEARAVGSIEVGGFTAWPIFITYAGGYRDPYAPVYNHAQIEERLRDFYASNSSKIRGAIGEAIRNVGQHAHDGHAVGHERCFFTPAALFVKEISLGSEPANRVLMAVVADEGGGISDPERSMLNGIGSMAGVDSVGMGYEMEGALLYLVKSRHGEWCLFDGARQINPDKYDKANGFRRRRIGEDEKIERVASLELDAPPKGCQKIMFFAHPSASGDEVREIHERLLDALKALSR
jgi:anti-sigma regulatory factor (Ser/Thr protein kinase)